MFFYYAQLNSADVAICLSQLGGEVVANHMVPITQEQYEQGQLNGMQYVRSTGQWIEYTALESGPGDIPVAVV
jgi:hypothetical protein